MSYPRLTDEELEDLVNIIARGTRKMPKIPTIIGFSLFCSMIYWYFL